MWSGSRAVNIRIIVSGLCSLMYYFVRFIAYIKFINMASARGLDIPDLPIPVFGTKYSGRTFLNLE
jgi:hypothetical protein